MHDHELLAEFADNASQEAFRQLVVRHIDAVYAAARRQVRDPQLAEDVTQAVFVVLARKAKHLNAKIPLLGWLMKTTYFASRDVIKSELRRKKHEQEAAIMTSEISESAQAISPEIDAAMSKLGDYERGAIALRYLESKSIAEVGDALGISSEAAAKRITRGLDRLRKYLTLSSTLPLATLLEHLPHQAAPTALTATVGMTTAAASSSISQGVIHMMLWSKAKVAAMILGVTAIATTAGVGTLALVQAQPAPPAPPAAISPFVAILNNGVSLELVGISQNPSKDKAWWFADGSMLPRAPYFSVGAKSSPDKGQIAREFAVRVNSKLPGSPESATVRWFMLGSHGSSSSTPMDKSNKPVPNLDARSYMLDDKPQGAILHADVASGPWKMVFTVPAANGGSAQSDSAAILVSTPFTVRNETHFLIAQGGINRDMDRNLVVIDTAGNKRSLYLSSMSGTDSAENGEYYVNLPIASVKEIQLQERPFNQWMKIRNIALDPGQQTDVQIVTSDQPKEQMK